MVYEIELPISLYQVKVQQEVAALIQLSKVNKSP